MVHFGMKNCQAWRKQLKERRNQSKHRIECFTSLYRYESSLCAPKQLFFLLFQNISAEFRPIERQLFMEFVYVNSRRKKQSKHFASESYLFILINWMFFVIIMIRHRCVHCTLKSCFDFFEFSADVRLRLNVFFSMNNPYIF